MITQRTTDVGMFNQQPSKWIRSASKYWLFAFIAAAILIAFVFDGYPLFQASMLLSYAVALVGLNLLTGYNGQISLGHGAFFGVGAYVLAITMNAGLPYWIGIIFAAVVSFCVGYLFGRPALKLQGIYLALATFTLSVVMTPLLKHKSLEEWTGGVGGLFLTKPDAPFGLPLTADQWSYLVTLFVTIIVFKLAKNMIGSGTGRVIRAVRDHQMAAISMGVSHQHYKSMTFAFSSAFAGIGGALATMTVQFVSPDSFPMFLSVSMLIGSVVGGIQTISGAFFGAAFLMFVPEISEKISKDAAWAVFGVVLIACVFAMPNGIAGQIEKIKSKLKDH